MSAPAAHDTAAEQDPIEGVVKNMHIVRCRWPVPC